MTTAHAATGETLDFAERWLLDGLRVLRPAFSVHQTCADMTAAARRLETLRSEGVQATYTHLVVRAAALALAENQRLHQIVAGNRRQYPGRVDIGLSVTGESFVAPVLVIESADTKSVAEIAAEVASRTPTVRLADTQNLGILRRWGWLVPLGVLRRMVLRALFSSPDFRRRGAGTFQVSTVPVDWAAASTFSAAGVLVAGRVWPTVVVVNGEPAVRPVMILTLSGDHGVWDGRGAARFLAAVKGHLESE